jgi:hypothetical protein
MSDKTEGENTKKKQQLADFARYGSMGIQMAAIIGGGVFGGIWLDGKLALKFPVFTLLLSLISIALALYYFIKDVIKKK